MNKTTSLIRHLISTALGSMLASPSVEAKVVAVAGIAATYAWSWVEKEIQKRFLDQKERDIKMEVKKQGGAPEVLVEKGLVK